MLFVGMRVVVVRLRIYSCSESNSILQELAKLVHGFCTSRASYMGEYEIRSWLRRFAVLPHSKDLSACVWRLVFFIAGAEKAIAADASSCSSSSSNVQTQLKTTAVVRKVDSVFGGVDKLHEQRSPEAHN